MEERDIQVRGYTLRLPLDVLLVASANPEDYTNRGRIITPLKDRFGAEVRTHYPLELADELAVMAQEADLVAPVPAFLSEILARFTRALRESSAIDQGSGVSARFSVAGAETVAAAALRRAALVGEARPTARPIDLEAVPDVLLGKLEFASGEEGREAETLTHLLRRATADTARARLRGLDLTPLADAVSKHPVRTGERVPAAAVVSALPRAKVLTEVALRLDAAGTEDPGPMAAAAELALEYLFLTRKLAKDNADDDTVSYG
jgi:magnesium chelatase subunit I